MLELKCVSSLIQIIFKFMAHYGAYGASGQGAGAEKKTLLEMQPAELRQRCSLRVIQYVDMICKFSLEQETSRGEPYEQIQRKIEAARQAKVRQRLRMTGNKGEKAAKGNDEEDDEDPEDKKAMAKLHANFMEQSEIVG